MTIPERFVPLAFALAVFIWIGHACLAIWILNNLYGRRLSKRFLKPWRLFTGLVILAFPVIFGLFVPIRIHAIEWEWPDACFSTILLGYSFAICLPLGVIIFPTMTILRLLRRAPDAVISEKTNTIDLWPQLGRKLIGNGKWHWLTRLPGNCVFRVDFTDLTLAPPRLPPEWDGLSILLLSDLHFHGTPAIEFFQRIRDEILSGPPVDLVVLAGDYVDSDHHREWILEILAPLKGRMSKVAILGNHDEHHEPELIRKNLNQAGFTVLSHRTAELSIRGIPCEFIGNESPWFPPQPQLPVDTSRFRLCVSHSPDQFYWAVRNKIDLVLCGHVHGGQIRLPVIGSIFIPSVYSRRFDQGVFQSGSTVMVVNRGLSGKEPLRFRCHAQVIRMELKCPKTESTKGAV